MTAAYLADADTDAGVRLDLERLLFVFRLHRRLFAAVAGFIFAVAAIVATQAPRSYTASASLVLEAPRRPDATGALTPTEPADSTVVDTEVQLLRSRATAERVVEALQLDADPAFWIGLRRKAPAEPTERRETAVSVVRGALQVRRSGLTSLITVAARSRDPTLAARLANGVADQALAAQSQAKLSASRVAGQALDGRLEALGRAALKDSAELAAFRTAHGLYTDGGDALAEQEAALYGEQLVQAQGDNAGDQARLVEARRQLGGEAASGAATGVAVDSPVLQALRGQRAQLSVQAAQLASRYGPRFPDLAAATKQLADVDAGIRAEVARIVSELQTRADISEERVQRLRQALDTTHARLADRATASVQLGELQRRADSSRQVYQDYLARDRQADASAGAEPPDARIASRADAPPKPSFPDPLLDLALGMVVAVGAGVVVVCVREAMHAGLSTGEDVEARLGLPHLGSAPALASVAVRTDRRMSPPDYLVARPMSVFGEAVRGLRTSLKFAGGGQTARVVAFTSAVPGEGKSTAALCLARSAARAGARVLLVDCDLRRRGVNELLGLKPRTGLLEVLAGHVDWRDTIVRDEPSTACILPLAAASPAPEAAFESGAVDQLLLDVSGHFDLVLLDTAPVLATAETRLLAARADAVVFLARWRRTPRKAVLAALRLLDGAGARVAGVALTQVDMRRQGHYGHRGAGPYAGSWEAYHKA